MRALTQITNAVIEFNRWLVLAVEEGRVDKWAGDPDDWELYSFSQTWGSTALGFGGIGGQAMTAAQTTVFTDRHIAVVFIGGGLAYVVNSPTEAFWKDVYAHRVKAVPDDRSDYSKDV